MNKYIQRIMLYLTATVLAVCSFAQDKKEVDVNINSGKNDSVWGQPWMWVVGAALFILLLVAILRSGSRKNA